MFRSTRECWNDLQTALKKHAKKSNYILKVDIANYFGSINQHTLINDLNDAGYPKSLSSRLEILLTSFTTSRSSRGILQGIFPSDFFGNYYLSPIDRFFDDHNTLSARYVDDFYIFLKSVDQAEALMRRLIPTLRTYDLVINEAKSSMLPTSALVTEEPDLEALFTEAISEIAEQLDDQDFHSNYGFQSDWDEEEVQTDDLELKATKSLFDSIEKYSGHEESIERFCLPLFSKASSDYALAHVLHALSIRPSMTQIYCNYMVRFIEHRDVSARLAVLLEDRSVTDWQKMWILATLTHVTCH